MINKNNTFNNELEKILEDKTFEENVKSALLNIFYHIEQSYKDYNKIKKEAYTIDKYLINLMNNIKEDCKEIKLITPNSKESKSMDNKTFLIDKKNKKIVCLNINRKLLYCIFKISKKDNIVNEKYLIINKTLSDLINVGYTINQVEPFRDFNGYSWSPAPSEIESITHNLIYQNLLILLKKEFMKRWVSRKELLNDFVEEAKKLISVQFNEKLAERYIEKLKDISFLLDIKYDKEIKRKMIDKKIRIEKELEMLSSREKYISRITDEKKKLIKQIKEIDEIVNNKEELRAEYKRRNEKLPMEQKIFSLKVLTNILEEERYIKIEKIGKLNNMLKPKKFVEYEEKLKEQEKYLKLLEIEDIDKEIEKEKLYLQKIFLECYKIKISNVINKQELLKIIYEYRYYCTLPYTRDEKVFEIEKLKEKIKEVTKLILKKSHEMRLIQKFSKNEEIDYELLKNIFRSHSLKLENINIKLIKAKDKNKLYIETYDEQTLENKEEFSDVEKLQNKDFEIRYNKKVKAFY